MNLPGMQSEIKPKRRREIYEDVAERSRPSGSYYVMMALSTIIAAYGLLINSAAVVVGAMLVAPLMGPIFGIALGLASGNRRLFWAALQSEVIGILIALVVGAAIGLAPLRLPIGSEWLVRTQPTLYDLAIALASGLAGAYALIDERVSPALPGVAISVAVLPPLATCGLTAAAGHWHMAGGAMMLFIANFFAIQIAAAVVFSIFGMLRVDRDPRARREETEGLEFIQFFKRFGLSIVVLLIIAAFMTRTLISLTVDRQIASTIDSTLTSAVRTITGARLSETNFTHENGQLRVIARVLTPRAFDTQQVGVMEDDLQEALGQDVNLIVRSMISRDMSRQGTVFTTEEDDQLAAEERQRREFLQRASQIASKHLEAIPGAELTDIHRSGADGDLSLTAVVRAAEPIGPDTVSAIQKDMRSEFGNSLQLTVRTVLTRVADSDQFLFEDQQRRLRDEREALASAVRTSIDSWLDANVKEALVDEVEVESLQPRRILVALLTPRVLTADEAPAMRDALAAVIGPRFELTVQYELGGRVTLAPEAPASQTPGGETED